MNQPLTDIEAEVDDSMGEPEYTVRWRRGDDCVALVCRPDGTLYRIISSARGGEPPVKTHVLALAAAEPPVLST